MSHILETFQIYWCMLLIPHHIAVKFVFPAKYLPNRLIPSIFLLTSVVTGTLQNIFLTQFPILNRGLNLFHNLRFNHYFRYCAFRRFIVSFFGNIWMQFYYNKFEMFEQWLLYQSVLFVPFSDIYFYINSCILDQFKAILWTCLKQTHSLFLPSVTINSTIFINTFSTRDHWCRKMKFQSPSVLHSNPICHFCLQVT